MTVQGIKGNEQQNNWLIPTVGAGVVGGSLGATVLAPAKYKSFEDLVADATKDDKFEMPVKAADDATDEVKTAFKTVEDAGNKVVSNKKALDGVFKEGVTEAGVNDVIKALGKDVPENVDGKKQIVAMNEIISKMKADSDAAITDEMKNIFKSADGKLPEKVDDQVKALWKTTTGVDFPAEGTKVTQAMIDGAKKNGEEAAKYLTDNKGVIDFVAGAKESKVTREAAENFAKSADTAATEAFEKISKQLGKNRLKGGLIWAAVGLAAGFVASKLLGNKAEKSA